jgi:hypothetical protein
LNVASSKNRCPNPDPLPPQQNDLDSLLIFLDSPDAIRGINAASEKLQWNPRALLNTFNLSEKKTGNSRHL